MATLLSFNGRAIVVDTPATNNTAFTSGGNFGLAHELARVEDSVRFEPVTFAGARGMEMKALGIADTMETSRSRIYTSQGDMPSIIYAATMANLQSWLASVEAWRSNPDNLIGTLLTYKGETLTNMYWADWRVESPRAVFGMAPGGATKAARVNFSAVFVHVEALV